MPGEHREQRIRELAYAIWEQEGRPEGQSERHWETAEKAIEAAERAEVAVTMRADGAPESDTPLAPSL
jgi:hypothetical protein